MDSIAKKSKKKNVLFLVPYPLDKAPSQRFRVEQFLPLLGINNIDYKIKPFMSQSTWDVLYKKGFVLQKITGIISGFIKRWVTTLFIAQKYTTIFIHREAAPVGPPVFEWILAKVFNKRIVYDFDDAIWIPNTSKANKLASGLKAFWKIKKICKWSAVVTAGNNYLAEFAKKSGARKVIVLPTTVDTVNRYNKEKTVNVNKHLVVGWTGTHSTLKYLEPLIPVLKELQLIYDFTFLVIADKDPQLSLKKYKFILWDAKAEIDDLLKIDIGVMPLIADEWSEGKCGFKLIQYMALGIPPLASPVGINTTIIDDGVSGILCTENSDWKHGIVTLLNNKELRKEMGKLGKKKIDEYYSLESQEKIFINLFNYSP